MSKSTAAVSVLLVAALCWIAATTVAQNEVEIEIEGRDARARNHADHEHGEHHHAEGERDELHHRDETLIERSRTRVQSSSVFLKDAGKLQEFEELNRHLGKLRAEAGELERTGRRDQAERVRVEIRTVERRLDEMHSHEPHEHPHAHIELARQKMEHLRAAAEHLQAAGAEDDAQRFRRQAEEIERAIHRELERVEEHHHGDGLRELREVVTDLRAEVRRLQQEVRELHQRLNRTGREEAGEDVDEAAAEAVQEVKRAPAERIDEVEAVEAVEE